MTVGQALKKSRSSLTVIDNRTGKAIEIPITNNSIPATAFKALKATETDDREEDDSPNGIRVYDPGYMNTAVVRSNITFIDPRGVLRYRGYPIEEVSSRGNFLESAYLLIYGELPSKKQFVLWEYEIMHHTFIADDLANLIKTFRYDSHPMSIFISAFAAMSAYVPDANPALRGQNLYRDKALMNKQIIRILGKATTIAAMAYRIRIGRPFVLPRSDLTYTENFLYMMDHTSEGQEYLPDPKIVKALDIMFILHADHEMNCSTATMTHVGSSLVDPYTAIAASAGALFGPLHGGANQAALEMLERIGSPDKVKGFLEQVKRKETLLFGFGHRVYRDYDPRSKLIRKAADMVFETVGGTKDPLIAVAIELEKQALADDYFSSRKLAPNVDFWSGLIYKSLGFPMDYFTVLFAVPRCAGWLAHWKQLLEEGSSKIWRPRQLYVGAGLRDYVELDQREDVENDDNNKGPVRKDLPHYFSKRRLVSPAKL